MRAGSVLPLVGRALYLERGRAGRRAGRESFRCHQHTYSRRYNMRPRKSSQSISVQSTLRRQALPTRIAMRGDATCAMMISYNQDSCTPVEHELAIQRSKHASFSAPSVPLMISTVFFCRHTRTGRAGYTVQFVSTRPQRSVDCSFYVSAAKC